MNALGGRDGEGVLLTEQGKATRDWMKRRSSSSLSRACFFGCGCGCGCVVLVVER